MSLNKLEDRRKELGLTLQNVADIVGVSKSTVMKWERGSIENMKRDKIALYASALQVSPMWIMGIESEESNLMLDDFQTELLSYINKMNSIGKKKVLDYSKDIITNPNYIKYEECGLLAAHERTDIEITEEGIDHDNAIMDDEEFWSK